MEANKNRPFKSWNAEELMEIIHNSSVRETILLLLTGEPMRICDISKSIGCKPPNIHSDLKKLHEFHIVQNKDKKYLLTVFGKSIQSRCSEYKKDLNALGGCAPLLNQFEELPEHFADKLVSLITSEKIRKSEINLLNNKEIFNCTEDLKLILPVFNTGLLKLLHKRTQKGLKTEIIVTPAIIRWISQQKEREEYFEIIEYLMNSQDIEIRTMENDFEVGLGVNGKWASFGLYKIGNIYDFSSHYTDYE